MHRKFKKLLHEYKVELFHEEHDDVEAFTEKCTHIAEDVLNQKFNYHFHKLPDANRAEIINMISNYTREAILPPVVEKIVERQVHVENRMKVLEQLVVNALEALSEDPAEAAS